MKESPTKLLDKDKSYGMGERERTEPILFKK